MRVGKGKDRTLLRSAAIYAMQTSIALLVCLFGLGQATTGRALEGTTVHLDPLSLEIGTGNTGTVDILVQDVADLYGFEFEITFDPAILEVVDADPGKEGVQIGAGDFLSPDWTLDNTVDNDNGTIAYALSQMNPSPPKNGEGILATITWRDKTVGTSPIHFAHVLLGATEGMEIPASTEDGQIVVVPAQAPAAATPTGTTAPTGTPSPVPPTSTPTSTPVPPMPTLTATPIPPTSTPSATAVLEATDPPAITPISVPPGTAAPTGVLTPTCTQVPTAAPVAQATETSVPVAIAAQPTSTPISTVTTQPVLTEGEALPAPLPPTTTSPSGSSGIPTDSLMRLALVCLFAGTLLLAASVGLWALWRKQ